MTALDDRAALRAADPSGMLDIVTGLGAQCREGYALGLGARPLPEADGITSIAFCGMGGSAIAGDVVAAFRHGAGQEHRGCAGVGSGLLGRENFPARKGATRVRFDSHDGLVMDRPRRAANAS